MGKEAKVCGSEMKKTELHSEALKTLAIPKAVGPLNEAKPTLPNQSVALLPNDHRLSKHFQMSLRAMLETARAARTKKVKDHLLGKTSYKLQL